MHVRQVVSYLFDEKRFRSLALWGVSSGATCAVLYLSLEFRRAMAKLVSLNLEQSDIFYGSLSQPRPRARDVLCARFGGAFAGFKHLQRGALQVYVSSEVRGRRNNPVV